MSAMRPFEAEDYADGWAACIAGKLRSDNPWNGCTGAWSKYHRDAWDRGWFHCERGDKWVDPRKKATR